MTPLRLTSTVRISASGGLIATVPLLATPAGVPGPPAPAREPVRLQSHQRHPRAPLHQPPRRLRADPASGARDQHHLVIELHTVSIPRTRPAVPRGTAGGAAPDQLAESTVAAPLSSRVKREGCAPSSTLSGWAAIIGPSPDGSAMPSSSHVKRPFRTSCAAL